MLARLLLGLGALLAGSDGPAAGDRCAALRHLAIDNVEIESAQLVSGAFAAPDGSTIETAPACRVRGIARPIPASRITFELWLPRDRWNGRYYQLGNGGFAGNIHFPSLAAEVARGNAAASTDTGHVGTGFDASWAAGRPERIVDYGHRSIKATSDAAHRLIRAYYGRPAHRRYFAGCSNGGRQALMAAQRYPEDWDGIIAGAPANMWTRQLTTFASLQHRLRSVPGAWIPPAKLPAIQRAALASCPPGSVRGGVAENPPACRFDPARLLCRAAETDHCLTAPQVESLRRIQAAGYEPTSAAAPDGWRDWILKVDPKANSQLTFATEAFRYLFGRGPRWTVRQFDRERDEVDPRLQRVLDADALDYGAFRRRGARIISYFGWADPVISPRTGLAYYRRVAAAAGGYVPAQDFYRLFMVPGMAHCQGGVGPVSFGQSIIAPPLSGHRRHDIRAALEAWVEQGIPPDELIATESVERSSGPTPAGTRILKPAR